MLDAAPDLHYNNKISKKYWNLKNAQHLVWTSIDFIP